MRRGGRPKGLQGREPAEGPISSDAPLRGGSSPMFALSQTQHRFVDDWIAVLSSPRIVQAPFVLSFSREGTLELPPQLMVETLGAGRDEALLVDNLVGIASALLPPELHNSLRGMVQLASIFNEPPVLAASEPSRFFFPLAPSNHALLAAYVAVGQQTTLVVWSTTQGEDPALAQFPGTRRSIHVPLPDGYSTIDRVTLSLFLLVRLLKLEPNHVLNDPFPDWPGAVQARRFLLWELLRKPNMQLYMEPPPDGLKLLSLAHPTLIVTFQSLGVDLPQWLLDATFPKEESLRAALVHLTRSHIVSIAVQDEPASHRIVWQRADSDRLVVVAQAGGQYLGLLYVFADEHNIWMQTSVDARASIASLRVDRKRGATWGDDNRIRVAENVGAHEIEFNIDEHRLRLVVDFGGSLTPMQGVSGVGSGGSTLTSEPLSAVNDHADVPSTAPDVMETEGILRNYHSPAPTPVAPQHHSAPTVVSPPPQKVRHQPQHHQPSLPRYQSPLPLPLGNRSNPHSPVQHLPTAAPVPPPPLPIMQPTPPPLLPLPYSALESTDLVPVSMALPLTKQTREVQSGSEAGPTLRAKKQAKVALLQSQDMTLRSAFDTLSPIMMSKDITGWWHSFRAIQMRFSKSPGLLVWYQRDPEHNSPNKWIQHPSGTAPPADAPSADVKSWWEWHQKVVNMSETEKKERPLNNVYALVDIEVTREDLEKLEKAAQIAQLLNPYTSKYSLASYIVRHLGPHFSMHDLRPRLSLSPGVCPGSVFSHLHLERPPHLTPYHWQLGFDDMGSALIDVYGSEEEIKHRLGENAWQRLCDCALTAVRLDAEHKVVRYKTKGGLAEEWYAQGHSARSHVRMGCDDRERLAEHDSVSPKIQIELKAGQLQVLPAGSLIAVKKWPSTAGQPIATLEGEIAWLGFEAATAKKLLDKAQADAHKGKANCFPEIAMLCCLMLRPENDDDALLQHEHLKAAEEMLRKYLEKEVLHLKMLTNPGAHISPKHVTLSREDAGMSYMCDKCSCIMVNGIVFCKVKNSTKHFCLRHTAEANTIDYALLDEPELPPAATDTSNPSVNVIHTSTRNTKRSRQLAESQVLSEPEDLEEPSPYYDAGELGEDDDDDLGGREGPHRHTQGWELRHTHELAFRFGPPDQLLKDLSDAVQHLKRVSHKRSSSVTPSHSLSPKGTKEKAHEMHLTGATNGVDSGAERPRERRGRPPKEFRSTSPAPPRRTASTSPLNPLNVIPASFHVHSPAPPSPLPHPHSPASAFMLNSPQAQNGTPPPLLTPANGLNFIAALEEVVNQRRSLHEIDHSLCRQLQDVHAQMVTQMESTALSSSSSVQVPASPSNGRPSRPKRVRVSAVTAEQFEKVLRLEHDLARMCHDEKDANVPCPDGDDCYLSQPATQAALQADYNKYVKTNKDVCRHCNGKASWQQPLHACIRQHAIGRSDADLPETYLFHLQCGRYPANVPYTSALFCPECFKECAVARSLRDEPFRRMHIWEHQKACQELYRIGFRIVPIPEDGLCFFTVLYLLHIQSSMVPQADEVIMWLRGRPTELMLALTSNPLAPPPLRAAYADVQQWAHRSRDEWRSRWNSNSFEAAVNVLPDQLERARLIPHPYLRFSYDPVKAEGKWFGASGGVWSSDERIHPPADVIFATFRYDTPVAHYALLQRL